MNANHSSEMAISYVAHSKIIEFYLMFDFWHLYSIFSHQFYFHFNFVRKCDFVHLCKLVIRELKLIADKSQIVAFVVYYVSKWRNSWFTAAFFLCLLSYEFFADC
jgi:hypothetical protein